jgi:hypothetical protein
MPSQAGPTASARLLVGQSVQKSRLSEGRAARAIPTPNLFQKIRPKRRKPHRTPNGRPQECSCNHHPSKLAPVPSAKFSAPKQGCAIRHRCTGGGTPEGVPPYATGRGDILAGIRHPGEGAGSVARGLWRVTDKDTAAYGWICAFAYWRRHRRFLLPLCAPFAGRGQDARSVLEICGETCRGGVSPTSPRPSPPPGAEREKRGGNDGSTPERITASPPAWSECSRRPRARCAGC